MNKYQITIDRTKFSSSKTDENIFVIGFHPASKLAKTMYRLTPYLKERNLTDAEKDFQELTTLIYYIDKICPRGEREQWSRIIEIDISLRAPQQFMQIQSDFQYCLSILGGDSLRFNVRPFGENEPIKSTIHPERKKPYPLFTDVALFSGGIDSLSGAISLIKNGRKPFFVRIDTHDRSAPIELGRSLRQIVKRSIFVYNQKTIKISEKTWNSERSQRLRSIYFLGIGILVAKKSEMNDVYINENGIMAIHLPLDPSRSSTFSTRTAYPAFLLSLERVVRIWLGFQGLNIKNLYVLKTKTEVTKVLPEAGAASLLKKTVSCAHAASVQRTYKLAKKNTEVFKGGADDFHCGYCFPCILRRVSVWSAGCSEFDVKYMVNPFRFMDKYESVKLDSQQEAKSAIISLFGFTRLFKLKPDTEILKRHPEIYETSAVLQKPPADIIRMHRAFADEVISYVNSQEPHLSYFFSEEKQKQTADVIAEFASEDNLSTQLSSLGNVDWNNPFEKKIKATFNEIRLRVQHGIANDYISKERLNEVLKESVQEAAPEIDPNSTKPVKLNQVHAKDAAISIVERCRKGECYPLGPAPEVDNE